MEGGGRTPFGRRAPPEFASPPSRPAFFCDGLGFRGWHPNPCTQNPRPETPYFWSRVSLSRVSRYCYPLSSLFVVFRSFLSKIFCFCGSNVRRVVRLAYAVRMRSVMLRAPDCEAAREFSHEQTMRMARNLLADAPTFVSLNSRLESNQEEEEEEGCTVHTADYKELLGKPGPGSPIKPTVGNHARPFVGVSQSHFFRDLVNFWR